MRRRLATVRELREKKALKFTYRDEGVSREGFLAWFEDRVVCYQNVCRHIPITLDYGDGQFFDAEATHFICQTHGATYEPLTGKCIAGPCVGTLLKSIPVEVVLDEIWIEESE